MAERELPSWLFHPLPANAVVNPNTLRTATELVEKLPGAGCDLARFLDRLAASAEFEPTVNAVVEMTWPLLPDLLAEPQAVFRHALARIATSHFPPPAAARVCRRLAKDPDPDTRELVRRWLHKHSRLVAK
jgi:RNA-directed DNA polymerase